MIDGLFEALFVADALELFALSAIVLLAGILRGAIGFGFSALVVASASFWLPPVAVISMVVLLEIAASLMMWGSTRDSLDLKLLLPLALGSMLTIPLGIWLLASLSNDYHQIMVSVYLIVVAILTLIAVRFKANPGAVRLTIVGMIAGFYNGLAAVGGVFIALFLSGSQASVRDIRATMSIYFLIVELAFLLTAWLSDIYTLAIMLTSLWATLPMFVGIWLGTHLFNRLPEQLLRYGVLLTLLFLSLAGLWRVYYG